MRKTSTALRALLMVAGIGFVGLCSATAFTAITSLVTRTVRSTAHHDSDRHGIKDNPASGLHNKTAPLAGRSSAASVLNLNLPPTDTFYIGLPGGNGIQTCLNLGGTGRFIQNIQHCGTGQTRLSVAVANSNCLNINTLSSFAASPTDTFCAQNCLVGGDCRDMVLIFNSVARNTDCGLISRRNLITINTPSCNAQGCYCFADSIDINDLKNNYTITDNGINYAGGYRGCNFDTIYSYTYFTVPNMGRRGPYRLDYWGVNGRAFTIPSFNTMQQLVDSMNVWDPAGNWKLDTTVFAISGGSTRNEYGQMKITRLANRAYGFLELNLGIISNGIQMCFNTGTHSVIFKNNVSGCADTITVKVVCPDTSLLKPLAVDDIVTTNKNQPKTINVLSNDNTNGALTGPLSITSLGSPRHGTASVLNNQIVYTPALNYCGAKDTLSYAICNANGCDTADVVITVNCDTPTRLVAVDDRITTRQNTQIRFRPIDNDTLVGTLLGINTRSQPRHGSIGFIGNDSLIYIPTNGYCGLDTMSYRLCNTDGVCDSATIFITVVCDSTNLKPVAVDDAATTPKNTAVTINVLSNDQTNGALTSAPTVVTLPTHGSTSWVNNQIIYTPDTDYCGNDLFTYQICNGSGCATATVRITVTCANNPRLAAVDDRFSTPKNTAYGFKPTRNDTLVGTLTELSLITNPSHGVISFVGLDSIIYTPNFNYCGNDTFDYRICNNLGACSTAHVYATVTCGNDTTTTAKPNAVDDFVQLKKGQTVTVNVTGNDTLNGYLTRIAIVKPANHGTGQIVNNQVKYTPNPDFCGANDTLSYEICNYLGCDTAIVVFQVSCDTMPPLKPDAINDIATTKKNQAVTIPVLGNDILNGTLTGPVRIVGTAPRRGTATVTNNQIIYTPNQDACGFKDSLSYEICNANGCDIALVEVTVNCDSVQLKPDAINDVATTPRNRTVTISVLGNDILNGTLTGPVRITSAPRLGTAVVTNNQIIYTSHRDSCGYKDTLSYEICNVVGCDIAQVVITVNCDTTPILNPIVAIDDRITTDKNTTITFRPTMNDTIRTRLLALSIVRMPSHGSISFTGLDTLNYVPTLDFCGLDTVTYSICDTAFRCATATIFITVKCPEIPKLLPIAINDLDSTLVNVTKIINVLANDTLNGILARPLSIVTQPTFGTVTVNNNGTVNYKPFAGYCGGNDVFTYAICNDNGCDTASVTVKITCDTTVRNKLPVAMPDVVTTRKNTPIKITILANDTINGTLDSIKIISSPLFGTAILGSDNVINYIPDSCGFTDFLIYRICNPNGCDTALVTIKVICDTTFRKPIAVNDSVRTSKNRSILINIVGNDSIFNAGPDTVRVLKNPVRGSVLVENGQIRYLPQTDSCAYRDTFTYILCTKGGCDTADVFVTVSCEEELKPIANFDTTRTVAGQSITIKVTLNDSLRGADTFRITRRPFNGVAAFDTLNNIRYTPNPSFCGKDTLIYEVCNRNGCDTAIVYITVSCVPPIAVDDSARTKYNQLTPIAVTLNDTLNGTDSIAIVTQPTRGSVLIQADKTINYTPSLNFCGKDSFQYVICNRVGCDSAWVRIDVSCGDTLIIYNAISPNGDGKNDGFYIRGIENYPENEVVVFNRWGNEVYRKKGYRNDEAWQGLWNGMAVPDGTYFYCIYLNDSTGKKYIGYLQMMK